MGRLYQLLIFPSVAGDGTTRNTFRPLEDGSYLSAAHEPVELSQLAGVRLAHSGLLTEAEVGAWRQHLEDYGVVPLFLQLY